MRIFVWNNESKYIIVNEGQFLLTEKPNLNFDYESISYSDIIARKNETEILTESEKNSIIDFIENFVETNEKAFCVDDNGNYLGYVDFKENENNKVPFPPPDDSFIWSFGKKDWQKKYYYNSTGNQTTKEYSIAFTTKVPPSDEHIFLTETESWIMNDVATYEKKFMTKIKSVGALLYYMDFTYRNQNHINEIISFIKEKAINDNKSDLEQLCDWTIEIIGKCETAKDKRELEQQLNECLMLINQKVMLDINEIVFLQTDTWKSIDNL